MLFRDKSKTIKAFGLHSEPFLNCARLMVATLTVQLSVAAPIQPHQHESLDESRERAKALCEEADAMWLRVSQQPANARDDGHNKPLMSQGQAVRDKYLAALELWRSIGDSRREALTLHRLAILSGKSRDGQRELWFLEQEVDAWGHANDPELQARRLLLLGRRYESMGDTVRALQQFERAVVVSQSPQTGYFRSRALLEAAALYRSNGAKDKASRYEENSRRALSEWLESGVVEQLKKRESTPPDGWIEAPSCPLVLEKIDHGGLSLWVLVNRSESPIVGIAVGCAMNESGTIKVRSELFSTSFSPTPIGSGEQYDRPFAKFTVPQSDWSESGFQCSKGSSTLIAIVTFQDGSRWEANGLLWP